ncbi:hypothetical protein ID866_11169 [Astraeus odoratus]|nr:hypothetical protein ID866_11169 [Astraeus odoratus]
MVFVGVGLGEVSTCRVVVSENQTLNKGDLLGHFHFGGSTHCLIFGPHIKVTPYDGRPERCLEGLKLQVGEGALQVQERAA